MNGTKWKIKTSKILGGPWATFINNKIIIFYKTVPRLENEILFQKIICCEKFNFCITWRVAVDCRVDDYSVVQGNIHSYSFLKHAEVRKVIQEFHRYGSRTNFPDEASKAKEIGLFNSIQVYFSKNKANLSEYMGIIKREIPSIIYGDENGTTNDSTAILSNMNNYNSVEAHNEEPLNRNTNEREVMTHISVNNVTNLTMESNDLIVQVQNNLDVTEQTAHSVPALLDTTDDMVAKTEKLSHATIEFMLDSWVFVQDFKHSMCQLCMPCWNLDLYNISEAERPNNIKHRSSYQNMQEPSNKTPDYEAIGSKISYLRRHNLLH